MKHPVIATRFLICLALVALLMPALGTQARADRPCGALPIDTTYSSYTSSRWHSGGRKVGGQSPYAAKADIRAYNPWVADGAGTTYDGLSNAYVMLYRSTGDRWAQSGWIKYPNQPDGYIYDPVVFAQARDDNNALRTRFYGPLTLLQPYEFRVHTNRSGYFSFWWHSVKFYELSTAMNWVVDSYEWMGEVANYTGDQLGGDNSNDPSHLKFRYTLIQNVVDQWIWAPPLAFITGSGNGGRPTRTQDTIQTYNPEFDLWDSRC